jgi:hypothetical protein
LFLAACQGQAVRAQLARRKQAEERASNPVLNAETTSFYQFVFECFTAIHALHCGMQQSQTMVWPD